VEATVDEDDFVLLDEVLIFLSPILLLRDFKRYGGAYMV
jgi:hypothetical protein